MATLDFTLDFNHDATVVYDQERNPRTLDFGMVSGAAPVVGMTVSIATVIDAVTLELSCSEAFTIDAELTDVRNYRVRDSAGVAPDLTVSAVAQPTASTLRLTVSEFRTGVTYEVEASQIKNSVGTPMSQGLNINRRQFTGTGAAPTATIAPATGATGVALATPISLDITDANSGVDLTSITITVEAANAFVAGVFADDYAGPASEYTAIASGYRIIIDPVVDFSYGQVVDIVVAADDGAGNPMA